MNNFFVRALTGILFVAVIVASFLRPEAMVLLFALITGLTIWEFTGLVNQREAITTNRMISTVAGVYFFLAVAGYSSDLISADPRSIKASPSYPGDRPSLAYFGSPIG